MGKVIKSVITALSPKPGRQKDIDPFHSPHPVAKPLRDSTNIVIQDVASNINKKIQHEDKGLPILREYTWKRAEPRKKIHHRLMRFWRRNHPKVDKKLKKFHECKEVIVDVPTDINDTANKVNQAVKCARMIATGDLESSAPSSNVATDPKLPKLITDLGDKIGGGAKRVIKFTPKILKVINGAVKIAAIINVPLGIHKIYKLSKLVKNGKKFEKIDASILITAETAVMASSAATFAKGLEFFGWISEQATTWAAPLAGVAGVVSSITLAWKIRSHHQANKLYKEIKKRTPENPSSAEEYKDVIEYLTGKNGIKGKKLQRRLRRIKKNFNLGKEKEFRFDLQKIWNSTKTEVQIIDKKIFYTEETIKMLEKEINELGNMDFETYSKKRKAYFVKTPESFNIFTEKQSILNERNTKLEEEKTKLPELKKEKVEVEKAQKEKMQKTMKLLKTRVKHKKIGDILSITIAAITTVVSVIFLLNLFAIPAVPFLIPAAFSLLAVAGVIKIAKEIHGFIYKRYFRKEFAKLVEESKIKPIENNVTKVEPTKEQKKFLKKRKRNFLGEFHHRSEKFNRVVLNNA